MEAAETRGGKALAALALHGQKQANKLADAYQDAFRRMAMSATTQVAKIKQELASLTGPTIRIDFAANETMRRLRALHREMQAYLTQNPLRLRIDLNTTATQRRLAELTRDRTIRINTINTSTTNTNRNNDSSGLSKIASSGRALSGITSMLGSITSGAGSAAKMLGIAGTTVVALGASAPAIAVLASALASVGVAAGGAAIAGVSALALAVGTLKVGMSGVGDAFSALGAEATGGGGAAVDTAKQMEDAQRALTRAVRDEKDAQKAVSDARKDALERLEDYNLEAKGAALSEKDAVLSLKEARADLAKGDFDDPLERERAALRVEQAEQRLAETRESNGDLESEIADARKKGVNGADEVVDANRRLEDATLAVKDAQTALNDVGKDAGGGGIDKAAEALAKLSPNAREFVLAVRAITPAWDEMKRGVQDSLFAGLAAKIQPLAATYLPMLGSAMTTVADGFNEGAISALNFAQSGTGVSVMSTLLGGSANMAANLGSALGNLVPGLAAIGASAANVFSPMTDGMAGAARGLSDMLVKAQQSGQMDQFFQSAIEIAKQFGAVLADVGGIIGGVFNAANAAGSGVMGTLGQVLDSVNQFVNSMQGQEALTSFFSSMMTAVGALLPPLLQLATIIATQVAPIIAQLATVVGPLLMPILDALSVGISALTPAIEPVAQLFASIAAAVTPLLPILGRLITSFIEVAGPVLGMLLEALSPIVGAIGEGLISAFQALQPAIEPIGTLLEALSPVITQIVQILGEVLSGVITALVPVITTLAEGFSQVLIALMPILPILGDALMQIIAAVAPMIQQMATVWLSVVQAILPLLPPLIQIVSALLPPLIQLITALLPIIMMSAQLFAALVVAIAPVLVILAQLIAKFAEVVGVVIGFVAKVIETVVGFVASVVGKFGELAQGISNKVEDAKTWVIDKFTALVEWVKGLPKKIGDAASGMWDGITGAFKSMVNYLIRMWNGFSDKLSFKIPDIPGVPKRGETIRPIPKIHELAQGGLTRGPGGPTGDKIPAMLSDREFVTRAKVVSQRGALPFLRAFNSGAITMADVRAGLPGFADGGLAGREPYGLPVGSSGGSEIFPQWVHDIEQRFGLTASTYPGHQEGDGQNKGIDWGGSVSNMQQFAEYLAGISGDLEQVIWMNPETGQQIGVADGEMVGPGTSQPGYYRDDWSGHQDHVHTRQSYSFGGTTAPDSPVEDPTTGSASASGSGSSSTPIGSGISSGSGAAGGPASWGNSGGGSKFNSATDAKAGGITPVWVENWPAIMGGSSTSDYDSGTYTTSDAPAPAEPGAPLEVPTLTADSSKEEVAAAIYAEAKNRGYSDDEAKAFISTGLQESGLQMVNGGGGAWHGYFQQDESYENRDDPNGNISGFLDRMDEKRDADPNSDIWKRIFWLQQRPGESTADDAYNNGRQGYLEEIQSQQDTANALFDTVATTGAMPVTVVDSELPPADPPAEPLATPLTEPLTTPQTEYTPTTTTPSASMPDPDVGTGDEPPESKSMPFGPDRANTWLREQDLATQGMTWGADASKEILGQFAEPFGLNGYVDKGIDQLVVYLRQLLEEQKKQAPAEVKYADVVNNYGMDPNKVQQKATEGMTAVTDTFRSG